MRAIQRRVGLLLEMIVIQTSWQGWQNRVSIRGLDTGIPYIGVLEGFLLILVIITGIGFGSAGPNS